MALQVKLFRLLLDSMSGLPVLEAQVNEYLKNCTDVKEVEQSVVRTKEGDVLVIGVYGEEEVKKGKR